MQVALAYSCAQGTATGSGFTASGQSGTATVTVENPPAGTNTATYRLTCNQNGVTAGAQCSVKVERAGIIFVANPGTVRSSETSLLGWTTSGMQSCVVSSPTDPVFTAQNSANTSVSGTASTIATSSAVSYRLRCESVSGGTSDATTTVSVR
jgi:hypothetical protein